MPTRTPAAFQLNLEQQKKRAKELLRAAQRGDSGALWRLTAHGQPRSPSAARSQTSRWKLADAQRTIARELRFPSWARLTAHAAAMQRQRQAITTGAPAPDAGLKTLHIRCGSDIQETLRQAGFTGDFLEHALPYYSGPVSAGPERHERMARFLVEAFPRAHGGLDYERVLAGLKDGERALEGSAEAYERVVLWMEHDPWDQLILARLLAAYAGARRPKTLELIVVNEFPGAARFLGIGQLPPEALRSLWATRRSVSAAQLSLGQEVWTALCADSPQHLASLARSGTPTLPAMAPALRRHLQELPWTTDGLSLTQRLILEIAAPGGALLSEVFGQLQQRDPLPSITDSGLLHIVNEMLRASEPPLLVPAAHAPTAGVPRVASWAGINPGDYYPPNALQKGVEGTVVVTVTLDSEGHPTDAQVRREAPPDQGFGDAALNMSRKLVYSNPTGHSAQVTFRLTFALHKDGKQPLPDSGPLPPSLDAATGRALWPFEPAQPLAVTASGTAVLQGARDFGALGPQPWWVGGVRASPRPGAWRWHEATQEVVYHG